MYYEEMEWDGRLWCRRSPDGNWELVEARVLWERLHAAQDRIGELETKLQALHNYELGIGK